MIDVNLVLKTLENKLIEEFKNRLIFFGLQGSRARGEANENSDIDIVVILDNLSINDLKTYKEIISSLEHNNLFCGFISGMQEIKNWEKSDLFQFYFDTLPIYKSLDFLKPLIKNEDIKRAVLLNACNTYHMTVHNFLYEKSNDILLSLYKSMSFCIKAKYFFKTNKYIHKNIELMEKIENEDKNILNSFFNLKINNNIDDLQFEKYTTDLMEYTKSLINLYNI